MYTVAVLDDDAAQAAEVLRMVEASPFADRLERAEKPVTDGNQLALERDSAPSHATLPDILFVDVRLAGDVNGIDLVQRSIPAGSPVQIIYISAYLEYAPSAYHTRHTWFLSKPLEQAELNAALERAIATLDAERATPLIVRQGSTLVRIIPSHVLYVESHLRKVRIHERDRTVETYARISDMQSRLPEAFVRCHKSFLVNMAYISELAGHDLVLANGEHLPVSQRCRKSLVERFTSCVGRTL